MYYSSVDQAALTDSGITLADAVRDDWAAVLSTTGPCDRAAAEQSVAATYAAVGRTVPDVVLWADSPFGGMVAAYALRAHLSERGVRALLAQRRGAGPETNEHVRRQVTAQLPTWPDARDQPIDPHTDLDALRSALTGAYYGSYEKSEVLWSGLIPGVNRALGDELGELTYSLYDDYDADYRGVELLRELEGRFDSLRSRGRVYYALRDDLRHPRSVAWLADDIGTVDSVGSGRVDNPDDFVFSTEFGGYTHAGAMAHSVAVLQACLAVAGLPPSEPLEAYARMLRSAGWVWALEDAVILTDRPVDDLTYADGYRVP